jgi:polyhydroxyalkanoate synthesis regulator phasin
MGLLRKSVELGFGALLLTKEAAEDLYKELTDEDGVEREKAHAMVDDLLARAGTWRDDVVKTLREEVNQAIQAAGLVPRSDYDALAARVQALESQVRLCRAGSLPFEGTSDF